MKVLVNNYKGEPVKEVECSYPKKVKCDECGSELEYEKSDVEFKSYGCPCITCPLCGEDTFLEDEDELTLTKDNISFPIHFYHTSKETGAVEISNEEIKRRIQEAINTLRERKDICDWLIGSGDTYVMVTKCVEDEAYNVFVAKDFYETMVSFEEEDY